jgi:hypothetical protein
MGGLSEDYLIRRINEAAAVIARIVGLKLAGKYEEAQAEIHQSLGQLLGLGSESIDWLDGEALAGILSGERGPDPERLEYLADLKREQGDVLDREGDREGSARACAQSLECYLRIVAETENPRQRKEISAKLDDVIRRVELDAASDITLLNLFCHYENRGEYRNAEDILARLGARPGKRTEIREELRGFYSRLMKLEPGELSRNGMSPEDLRSKLAALG